MKSKGYSYLFFIFLFCKLHKSSLRGGVYPFGLTMSGISDNALNFGQPENKYKYNGIEKENEFELGIYDAQLRELDGQTGRWWQIDPKIESMEMWSPYASNYNNPILYSDPFGDEPECCGGFFGDIVDGFVNKAKSTWHAITHPKETITNALSVEGLKNNLLNTVSFGFYSDAKTLVTDGPGKFIGGKLFDGVAVVVTDGITKSITPKGIVYERIDKAGTISKPYVGQSKSEARYAARQKEHARVNPRSDFDFKIIDKGKPGKNLDKKEQKALDAKGGPTNKSNPNGGTSNKKNVIKKEETP